MCSELVSTREGHFKAFLETLKRIREPWSQLVEILREQFGGEIVERLEKFNTADDIFNWASPVYFQ